MYKTATEYYREPVSKHVKYSYYQGPSKHVKEIHVPSKEIDSNLNNISSVTQMKWKTKHHINMTDPSVWGPAFWFTLHNGASKYPTLASPITKNRMKGYIIGIPTMLPCVACTLHATNHIEKNKDRLDDICSGREKLFTFFVDFHNIVNKRYNKPILSVEEAYNIYNKGVDVSVLSY